VRFNANRLRMLVGLVSVGMFLRAPIAPAGEPVGHGPRGLARPDMARRVDGDLPGLPELQGIRRPVDPGNPFSLAAPGRSSSTGSGLTAADPARADRVVVEVYEQSGADFTPYYRTITTTTYDRNGRAARVVIDVYPLGDEYLSYRDTYTYSYVPRGDLGSLTNTLDYEGDGTIDWRETASFEYDQRGHLMRVMSEVDDNADGTVDGRVTGTVVTDARGNLLKEIVDSDRDVDGTVDDRAVFTWEYDSQGRLTGWGYETDVHADGTIDGRLTESDSYDAKGNLARSVNETEEYGAEGTITFRTTRTMTHDSRGLKTREVSDYFYRARMDYAWAEVSSFEYDTRGSLVRSEMDQLVLGTNTIRVTRAYTYDPDGDLLKLVVDSDRPPDGTVDSRYTYTYSYTGPGSGRLADHGGARVTQEPAGAGPILEMAAPGLAAATPNPFSSEITLRCVLSASGPMSLRIYDAAGRLVRTLADGTWDAGEQRAVWDGRDDAGRLVPSGAYFARMRAGGREATATLLRAR
jgi:flagellar hook capping protein FlgD